MDVNKIRGLGAEELEQQQRETTEQIFRLRFQTKMGQTEGVNKLRTLRKDIARMKTVERERALGIQTPAKSEGVAVKAAAAEKPAKKSAAKKKSAKKAAER